MPEWFPPAPMPFPLHFCEVLAATHGFLKDQGGVMFPELLSRTEPMDRQVFGLVFIDRLSSMAIIGELHADLAAIDMLARQSTNEALATADCLVLDRIACEAWLPRARSQVNSVAARQLLLLVRDPGFSATTATTLNSAITRQ